jgi:hypothetical protein
MESLVLDEFMITVPENADTDTNSTQRTFVGYFRMTRTLVNQQRYNEKVLQSKGFAMHDNDIGYLEDEVSKYNLLPQKLLVTPLVADRNF